MVRNKPKSPTLDRHYLVQAILDLEAGNAAPVPDRDIAEALGEHVRPYVNQVVALQDTPGARHRTVPQEETDSVGTAPDPEETSTPQGHAEAGDRLPRLQTSMASGRSPDLTGAPAEERARWIFMDRFLSLERLQQVLGCHLDAAAQDALTHELGRLLDCLLALPETRKLVLGNRLHSLQELFASTVLLMRHPFLADAEGNPVPCTVASLREKFPAYFYTRRKTPNWYEGYDFYTSTMPESRWVLCSLEYLHCTLRRPQRKLANFARGWRLPADHVRQKTILEDLYDRVVCGELLQEQLFEQNCSSCTSTTYRPGGKAPERLVYAVQRQQKIAIHGKSGLPHWRAARRLWPGVFPSILLPATAG